jgi:hypothetical protein
MDLDAGAAVTTRIAEAQIVSAILAGSAYPVHWCLLLNHAVRRVNASAGSRVHCQAYHQPIVWLGL